MSISPKGHAAMVAAEELNKQFRESGGDPRFINLDGDVIDDYGTYWDYDLRRVTIDFVATRFGAHWDGWFETRYVDSGQRGSIMNASRLWTRHPSTGKRASEATD